MGPCKPVGLFCLGEALDKLTRRIMMHCVKSADSKRRKKMSTTTNIRNYVQSKVQDATDRIKPLEENTRRFIDATAERVRVSTPSTLKKMEANIREQLQLAALTKKLEEALPNNIDINALSERLSNNDIKEKLSQAFKSVFDRLNQPTEIKVDELNTQIADLNKKVRSLDRRMESRIMRKDIKPLVTRLDKLEKVAKK
jgi:polyhydroxyalkanoate synthesis regulator phasin